MIGTVNHLVTFADGLLTRLEAAGESPQVIADWRADLRAFAPVAHVIVQHSNSDEFALVVIYADAAEAEKELAYLSHHGDGYEIEERALAMVAPGYCERVDR